MKTAYRVITCIFCVLVFPIAYFMPILHVYVGSALSETSLLNNIGLKEYMSVNFLVNSSKNESDIMKQIIQSLLKSMGDKDSKLGSLVEGRGYVIAALVLFIIALVAVLVLLGFAAFSKKYIVCSGVTLFSIASLFAAEKCFDRFAAPFLSGKVSLGNLINSDGDAASLLSGLLGSVAQVKIFELGIAASLIMFILCIVLILGICALVEKNYEKK